MNSSEGKVRALSLDEWFLSVQLEKIKEGFHLPFAIKVDITHLVKKYEKENRKLSLTALMIKASSLLIKETPEFNRAFFNTIFGKKIIEPNYNAVNVPIEIVHNGKKVVSSIIIRDAYQKSLEQISGEIGKEKTKALDDLPVNKIIHGSGNYHLNKIKLRLILFIFSNFPSIYLKKRGGGISVSSLFAANKSNYDIFATAYAMTTLVLCSASTQKQEEKTFLTINIGFDHVVTHGADGVRALAQLVSIFNRDDL